MEVRHAELIGTLSGFADVFSSVAYAINPGLSATFPWLSTLAAKYQQYRFKHLKAWFITRAPTTVEGSILMAPSYVPSNGDPADEETLASFDGAIEGSPWTNLVMDLLPHLLHTTGTANFVRTGYVAAALDLYDAAKIYFATLGFTSDLAAGKLWLDYEVELMVPLVRSDVGVYPLASAKWHQSGDVNGDFALATNTTIDLLNITAPSVASGPGISYDSLNTSLSGGHSLLVPDEGWYRVRSVLHLNAPVSTVGGAPNPNSDSWGWMGIRLNGAGQKDLEGAAFAGRVNSTYSLCDLRLDSIKWIPEGALLRPQVNLYSYNNTAAANNAFINVTHWEFTLQKIETGGVPPAPQGAPVPVLLTRAPTEPVVRPVPRNDMDEVIQEEAREGKFAAPEPTDG